MNHIAHVLVLEFGMEIEDAESVAKIIEGHLTRYENQEILEAWVDTLPTAAVNFNHDMVDGYYTIKHDGKHGTFYHFDDLRKYLRYHQLNPLWAGATHYKPKELDTIYTIVDVPEQFKAEY